MIPADRKEVEVAFKLERWVHMKKRGWYSVDHHVHAAGCSHYESPKEGVQPEHMWRQALGEDLNVSCVLTWGPCWYFQKGFFEGKDHELSMQNYVMRYDVEVSGFPSSHAGHICLLRLKEDDFPGTTKVEQWPSWTLPVLQWAQSQDGITGYAHSGWGLQPIRPTREFPNYIPAKFDGIGANEFIVTVTHDATDFISAGDTPWHWELNIWYHTLNVGFRTRISGARRFPVGPSMASTRFLGALPPGLNSSSFLPLATYTRVASLASRAASARPSFLPAETFSLTSIPWVSRNLDTLVQLVQPFR